MSTLTARKCVEPRCGRRVISGRWRCKMHELKRAADTTKPTTGGLFLEQEGAGHLTSTLPFLSAEAEMNEVE